MHNHPQVYADLSLINWLLPRATFHDYLRRLVEAGLGDRLMYGSDAGVWPDAIRISVEALETASFLTTAQQRNIFYNNAVRFLRLSP
jgi:predicted TIM-barrel fold metal-dependent hydrolase